MLILTNFTNNFDQNLQTFLARITRSFTLFSHWFWPLPLLTPYFFFFFFGTFGPDRMGLTAPSEYGIAKGQLIFFFVTTPSGWYHTPKGCDNETFNAHTRVSCNFGLFEPVSGYFVRQGFGQNCGHYFLWKPLRGDPSGQENRPKLWLKLCCRQVKCRKNAANHLS